MILILLLDLAGIILVIGYVLLDRHQNASSDLPGAEPRAPHIGFGPSLEQGRAAQPVSRSDEA